MDQKKTVHETIADAFKELMMKRDFEKITVKMIAAQAGITRSRFYNYFQDKYEILEWIIRHQISEKVSILIEKEMYMEALRLMFSCIEEDKPFFTKAFRIHGQNGFEEILGQEFTNLFVQVYKSVSFDFPNKVITRENTAGYQALALIMYLRLWVCDGRYGDASWDEVCDAYIFMLTQSNSMISPKNLLEAITEKLPHPLRHLLGSH
ncbi:MAG: TetR family transcriptional regulator [Oscillospiraceae bacterium]|nr:TetR family transcriptional regulator [Oscillospiraceae bacterium]